MKVTLYNPFGSPLVRLLSPTEPNKVLLQVPNGTIVHASAGDWDSQYMRVYLDGTQYLVNSAHVDEAWARTRV